MPVFRDNIKKTGERFPDKANLIAREGRKAAGLYSTKTTRRWPSCRRMFIQRRSSAFLCFSVHGSSHPQTYSVNSDRGG